MRENMERAFVSTALDHQSDNRCLDIISPILYKKATKKLIVAKFNDYHERRDVMICGRTGMATLKGHLAVAHNLKQGQYRKQINIPKDQPLAATEYVAKKHQMALDRGVGDKLVAARVVRKIKQAEEKMHCGAKKE
jgi:hypothetical protein